MRRPMLAVTVVALLALAGCGGPGPTTGTVAGQATPAPAGSASAAGGAQFGGDVCSALTRDEVTASTFPQGKATFDSTDTQKDAAGAAVVCQYLVVFDGKPSTVAVAVSLMDDTEYATRTAASLLAPPVAVPGVGTEAFLVQPAPGLFEVWVSGAHGKFKVGTQAKDTSIALATIAAGRD